mmetsp:Transcript_26664/g.50094  ORF Transcript_26664/g.50094 Transcript_26664/m.50094 type:complete len:265 (-) Transcript_26664:142-936(-)
MVAKTQVARASACGAAFVILAGSDPVDFTVGRTWQVGQWRRKAQMSRQTLQAEPRRSEIVGLGSWVFGLFGWAGWLSESPQGQVGEAGEVGADARRLGLGADRIEDVSTWEISFFKETLDSVARRAAVSQRVVYHYTDIPSAEAIISGRMGVKLSRGGYKGGGVFFSTASPVDSLRAEDSAMIWRDCFPAFRSAQLKQNYGTDRVGREDKADAVLVCFVTDSMLEDISERTNACFIPLDRFEAFAAEYFAYRNIPRAYRLAPPD